MEAKLNIVASWINTPFAIGGRIKGHKADCLAPLIDLKKKFLYIPDYIISGNYHSIPHSATEVKQAFDQEFKEIAGLEIGLFCFAHDIPHIGYLNSYKGTIIHSYQAAGRFVEHRFCSFFKNKLINTYRV